ncbi:MAG: 50S ribosomal protein L25, partial [Verrucomicrobiota bacterium]
LDGDPVGVKQGGVLEQLLRELPIACLPKHLPELIHVDVSALDVGDGIHINEMELPEGVSAQMAGEILVASVAESRATKSDEAEDEEAATAGGGEEASSDEAAKEGGEG